MNYEWKFLTLYRKQETGIRTISRKKKWKKAKWLSVKALQIVEKRRAAKGKGEKERYTHLNILSEYKDIPSECRVPKNNKER